MAGRNSKVTGDFRLAVDIGNTQTVLGLFRGAAIRKRWRFATRPDATVDEIALWLRGLAAPEMRRVGAAGLASVVPALDPSWLAGLREVFGAEPQLLDYRHCRGLRLDYEVPRQIGADRLANVLGAEALGIKAGVVIDFGTATTFDVFADHAYFGGIICPGIQTSMRSLVQNAAKLTEAELRWPEGAVGRNTDDALRIGILHGTVGMIERLLAEVRRECDLGPRATVLATGGLADWLRGRTRAIQRFEPDLTLIGINYLLSGPAGARKKRSAS